MGSSPASACPGRYRPTMATWILLDAGLLGLASVDPQNPTAAAFTEWVRQKQLGADVCVTSLTRYEARRDLIRARLTANLARLDRFCQDLKSLSISNQAWEVATDFWAIVHRRGRSTASLLALDADAILGGAPRRVPRRQTVIVATTNSRHLGWFPGIVARLWQSF